MATAIRDEQDWPSPRLLAMLGIADSGDLACAPHLLIAGATGQGKSVRASREQCASRLRELAETLERLSVALDDAYLVLVSPACARLLSGGGSIAPYWNDLSPLLRLAMLSAADGLENCGDADCYRESASLMRVAADRIGGPVG